MSGLVGDLVTLIRLGSEEAGAGIACAGAL